jgi:hypothetical protein
MKSFIKSELERRAKHGITSMSALAPDTEEVVSEDEAIEF